MKLLLTIAVLLLQVGTPAPADVGSTREAEERCRKTALERTADAHPGKPGSYETVMRANEEYKKCLEDVQRRAEQDRAHRLQVQICRNTARTRQAYEACGD